MEPTLLAGEYVLAKPLRSSPGLSLEAGELVVCEHPQTPDVVIVKRVSAVSEAHITVLSDNSQAGTDSRQWGPIGNEQVVAKVTLNLNRPLLLS